MAGLSEFRHRSSYAELPDGRDRYNVAVVGQWLTKTVRDRCRGGVVLDVGCGEQPLRSLVEQGGARYVGMDIVQNEAGTVAIVAPIDAELPSPWPDAASQYDVVICSEVLEHVRHWPRAFANLRRLTKADGYVLLTVPFVFPLHMEPHDFHRATMFEIEALAVESGFSVIAIDRLGSGLDVLSTIAADVSVLPLGSGLWPRVKARTLRALRRILLTTLGARWIWRGLQVNANTYLSNGVVLGPPVRDALAGDAVADPTSAARPSSL